MKMRNWRQLQLLSPTGRLVTVTVRLTGGGHPPPSPAGRVRLGRGRATAGDRTVAIAGGAATGSEFLAAVLIDAVRRHVTPVPLGRG